MYAIMLFMIATLIAVLILSSSLTALKRSRAKIESRQASLMLNSAASLLQDYFSVSVSDGKSIGGLSYEKTTTTVVEKTEKIKGSEVDPSGAAESLPVVTYNRNLKVSHNDQSYTTDKLDTASINCEVSDSGSLIGNMTYTAPANPDLFLPEMIHKGLMKGLLFVDQGAGASLGLKYESENNKTDDGVIYMRLPYDASAGKNTTLNQAKAVKITYVILPKTDDSGVGGSGGETTDYEIVFTLTLADITNPESAGSKTYKDTEYRQYLVVPVSSIKEDIESTSSKDLSSVTDPDTGWITKTTEVTTIKTSTITWQAGTICSSDPLLEKQKTE